MAPSVRPLHLDRPRENNVVFEMNVLMQVRFESRQRLVKRPEADTGIKRRGVSIADLAHVAQRAAGSIVLVHHHRNRIAHAPEGRRQHGLLRHHGFFHANDVREQNHLLLHQVSGELARESGEDLAQAQQFGMVRTVHRAHLIEQRAQAGEFLARVGVVGALYVRQQLGERLRLPVTGWCRGGLHAVRLRQCVRRLLGGNMCRLARLFESLATTAAIVDPQLFKHAGRARDLQRQFAYRFFSRNTHRFLLDNRAYFGRACRAYDFCHSQRDYSARSTSASKAFRSGITARRPSSLTRPSACNRERLRETSSRTVPSCAASSWLLPGSWNRTPSPDAVPSRCARRSRKTASRWRTVVNESSSIIPTSRRSRAPTTRSTLSATSGCARQSAWKSCFPTKSSVAWSTAAPEAG